MIISFQGGESFKISQGDLSIAMNPQKKTSADVALLSTNASGSSEGGNFVVKGPGEYEVKDVVVKGFLSEGPEGKINTIYMISFEGMNLCFLGALSNPALPSNTLENLEDIDILFVPVGGEGMLDAAAAYKLAVSLEPSIIIPMHYTGDSLKKFLKEAGEDVAAIDKLVVKKKDLEAREGDIVILSQE
jgi:L-ascorbate metabolism protein UlaG (beta-lactamase superfamily)